MMQKFFRTPHKSVIPECFRHVIPESLNRESRNLDSRPAENVRGSTDFRFILINENQCRLKRAGMTDPKRAGMTRVLRTRQGFALIFVIFLAVSLETVVAGNMVNMMRFQRETQRASDLKRLTWAAEGLIERTSKYFREYTGTYGKFPETKGDDKIVMWAKENDETFSAHVTKWWNSENNFANEDERILQNRQSGKQPALNQIQVNKISVKELTPPNSISRRYEISVGLTHGLTQVQTTITHQIGISHSKLSEFAIFYDEDLEIGPGPDATIQGPIFSNKNIYLMNNAGSTLKLVRANDFSLTPNNQPYVMRAAGNIYFYFKRGVGRNYLLDNQTYHDAVPDYYTTAEQGLEIMPAVRDFGEGSAHRFPPLLYYYYNLDVLGCEAGTDCTDKNGKSLANTIQVEVDRGFRNFTMPHPKVIAANTVVTGKSDFAGWDSWGTPEIETRYMPYYSFNYEGQPLLSKVSISSAFNFEQWPGYDSQGNEILPLPNRNWNHGNSLEAGTTVQDGVSRQDVPIGNANSPDGVHTLIDPLTGTDSAQIFPPGSTGTRATQWDDKETESLKLQKQANVNVYISPSGTESADFTALKNDVFTLRSFTDLRLQGSYLAIEIDLQELFIKKPDARIMYVHVYRLNDLEHGQGYPKIVILKNGGRLPQGGFTLATNGRLWIKGDYNIFSYNKCDGLAAGNDDPRCHVTIRDWENHACLNADSHSKVCVPPAAIFSDSVGVLSKEWENHKDNSNLSDRAVTHDVMVNTAIVTGFLESSLEQRFNQCVSSSDMGNDCTNRVDYTTVQQNGGHYYIGGIQTDGSPAIDAFRCEETPSYLDGMDGVKRNCEFYQESPANNPKIKYYYINPKSYLYQDAQNIDGTALPKCNLNDVSGTCNHIKIPIMVDPFSISYPLNIDNIKKLRPISPFHGVYFKFLSRTYLFRLQTAGGPYQCTGRNGCGSGHLTDPLVCERSEIEGTYCRTVYQCTGGGAPCLTDHVYPPQVNYDYIVRFYSPLYQARSSGGLENLANFQEDWNHENLQGKKSTLRFSGSVAALWFAKELYKTNGTKAYFKDTSYYSAPERLFDYNESLKEKAPPGIPSAFQIKRVHWSQSNKKITPNLTVPAPRGSVTEPHSVPPSPVSHPRSARGRIRPSAKKAGVH